MCSFPKELIDDIHCKMVLTLLLLLLLLLLKDTTVPSPSTFDQLSPLIRGLS